MTSHWVSGEPVPVFWPHVGDVSAAIRPAIPITVLPTTGSSIAKRGTRCLA